jgi:demethylmenaquinone methyltransferase/2-methoxy-6-polyprenyl-1,4-benzoquinol methylase
MSEEVDKIFSDIAPRYDATNYAISFGLVDHMRHQTVQYASPKPGESVIDCACGTGELTVLFKEAVGRRGRVVGTDVNPDMMELAPPKARERGLDIEWRIQDAMDLDVDDDTFDIASIAWGVRNVDAPSVCLAELARVVRPGGRVAILEFGRPHEALQPLYRLYNRVLLPVIGGWVSGSREAYDYLQRTSDQFPSGDDFVAMMEDTGAYRSVEAYPLVGGINYVYIGWVQ